MSPLFTKLTDEKLAELTDGEDAYFAALSRLFSHGQLPEGINGFLHGGVVAVKSNGFFKKLELIGMDVQYPDEAEAEEDVYVKSFFFVSQHTESIRPDGRLAAVAACGISD